MGQSGSVTLTVLEVEALRGLIEAEKDVRRRRAHVMAEILREFPDGAVLTSVDLESHTGTWTAPEAVEAPEQETA